MMPVEHTHQLSILNKDMKTSRASMRQQAAREIEIIEPNGRRLRIRHRTMSERAYHGLLLACLIAVSCGLWFLTLLSLWPLVRLMLGQG
jgi:hypothetical protein